MYSPGPWIGPTGLQPSLGEALSLGMGAMGSEGQEEGETWAHQGTWNRVGCVSMGCLGSAWGSLCLRMDL
jgi:hypothetical protein